MPDNDCQIEDGDNYDDVGDDDSDDDDRHPVCPMMIVKLKMGDGLLVAARYDHRD